MYVYLAVFQRSTNLYSHQQDIRIQVGFRLNFPSDLEFGHIFICLLAIGNPFFFFKVLKCFVHLSTVFCLFFSLIYRSYLYILWLAVQLLSRVQLFETPELQPTRLLCTWDFPDKNAGVGCHFLLPGIFPTLGSNPCLL